MKIKAKILTEGKHWPEDYMKTAYNLIKQSSLGQQSWYSDEYIKKDIYTFIDEFAPLSHKSSNLGFFMAIVRWFIEYSGTSKERYQEFIERKLDMIIATLLKIRNDKEYDSRSEEIKKMNFGQFMKLIDEVNSKHSFSSNVARTNAKFNVIPIYSYKELNEKYGGNKTGWHGESEWCHTNGKSTYDSWTKNGTQMFFVVEREGWQQIKVPARKPNNCYDEYGMSLIAILVDVVSNKLLNSTSRWNHIVLPASGAADMMFKSWKQLNDAVNLDVERICKDECGQLAKKIEDEIAHANEIVENILKSVDVIEKDTIPEKLKNYVTDVKIPDNVTSIGWSAFDNCRGLTSVTIPDSVTSIGDGAFSGCNKLTSVTIPSSVTSIRRWAFSGCSSLTNVMIGNGVMRLWEGTFEECTSLTSVTIPDSVTSIGYGAFRYCSKLISVTIPDSVTSIGGCAFYECSELMSLMIPNSVTSIGNYAFSDCSGLTSVTIPDSVTRIEIFAFAGCSGLTSLTIPDSVTRIGYRAFYECSNLKSLIFKGKTIKEVKTMKDYPWGIEDESIIKCEDSLDESDKFKISKKKNSMKKQYTKKQITEAIAYWQDQLSKMNEGIHDGRNILPKHQSRRNLTDKKTLYYLAVDMSDDITNYGQYIRPDGTLTDDMSSESFKECGVTQVPETLKKKINDALARYGNEYHIFVYHQPYSYGYQTKKNHARPSVIDVWYPNGKYWRYDLKELD